MREKTGRKMRYGEPTEPMRIPVSMIPLVQAMLDKREVLETQWQEKQIGPDAQKLVNLIVESVMAPKYALIEVYEESGVKSFQGEAKRMRSAMDAEFASLSAQTTLNLIGVLSDTQ
jgi:hypothetical protein